MGDVTIVSSVLDERRFQSRLLITEVGIVGISKI